MKPHENRIEEEKDMASSPETAPVADSAGNDGTTPLAVYFEVDPALYASVRLKRLPFNRRASGCLKRSKIMTLEELLSLSEADILKIRNAGKGSVQNIKDVIQMYLEDPDRFPPDDDADEGADTETQNPNHDGSAVQVREVLTNALSNMLRDMPYDTQSLLNYEADYMRRCEEAKALLGGEACLLALENPERMLPVLLCLMDFSREAVQKMEFRERIRTEIDRLSPQRRAKKLLAYLRYYVDGEVGWENVPDLIPEDASVQDMLSLWEVFWQHRQEGMGAAQVLQFVQWLDYDIPQMVQRLRSALTCQGERGTYIIQQRAAGATLEQLGSILHITRERVRQVELKVTHKFVRNLKQRGYDLIQLIYAEKGGEDILQLSDVREFMDEQTAQILWHLIRRDHLSNPRYHYDANFDGIVFAGRIDMEQLNRAADSMPTFFMEAEREKLLAETAARYALPPKAFRQKVRDIYRVDGLCYHRSPLTVLQMCLFVLKERFPDGYKIADEEDQEYFLSGLRDTFGRKVNMTARTLDAKVGGYGLLCGRGKYLHPDYVEAPQSLMDEINQYIQDSPRTVLSYAEIYHALSDRFVGTKITNRYFLQGALKKYGCPFILRKNYVTKDQDVDLTEEFSRFVEERGDVYRADILEEFSAFTDANLGVLVNRCPEVITLDTCHYMHASRLYYTEEDRTQIGALLQDACHPVPISARSLLSDFTRRFPDFMTRNRIDSQGKLFGILQYLFRDKFHFSRPYIALEDMGNITRRDVVLRLLDTYDTVAIPDLVRMCKQKGTPFQSAIDLAVLIQPEFIRINETMLLRRHLTGLSDEVVMQAAQNIQESVRENNGYCAARNITDYRWYPPIQVEWNPFVLESVDTLAGDALPSLRVFSSVVDVPLTVFIGEEYAEEDMNSLTVKLLAARHREKPFASQGEVLRWLQEQGLCNVKLPDFLERDGYLVTDEYGRLQVREHAEA